MTNNKFMRVKIRKSPIEGVSLFHYVTCGENPKKETLRNLIYTFKENSLSNQLFKEYLAEKIAQYLPELFECKKEDLVILCVPTSKKKTLESRYKKFCDKLNSMGIKADYETFYLTEDVKTKHKMYMSPLEDRFLKEFEQCIRIKRENIEKLKGKKVVIFDDVITNGSNIRACYEALRSMAGVDSTFLTLGRTYNQKYEGEFAIKESSTSYEYGENIEKLMTDLEEYVYISKLLIA